MARCSQTETDASGLSAVQATRPDHTGNIKNPLIQISNDLIYSRGAGFILSPLRYGSGCCRKIIGYAEGDEVKDRFAVTARPGVFYSSCATAVSQQIQLYTERFGKQSSHSRYCSRSVTSPAFREVTRTLES